MLESKVWRNNREIWKGREHGLAFCMGSFSTKITQEGRGGQRTIEISSTQNVVRRLCSVEPAPPKTHFRFAGCALLNFNIRESSPETDPDKQPRHDAQ